VPAKHANYAKPKDATVTSPHQTVQGVITTYADWHREVRITESASATAFWLLIAFGPAGLVAINVLGLFVDQGAIAEHLIAIAGSAPGSFGDLLVEQLAAVASPSPGSIVLDAVLVVTSLWTISTAVAMLMRGLRRGYGLPVAHFLPLRLLASIAGLTAIIVLGLLAFAIDMRSTTQQVVGITCAVALAFALIMVLHALAVGRSFALRSLWPGATFAALALLLIQLLWERASALSPSLAQTYGGIAGLVTSMLGVWLAAFAILLGAFVNKWLSERRSRSSA
jgi:membrane protein